MSIQTERSKILLIGAGPVIIGQGGEYDYAAVQAGRYLRASGHSLVVVNSNAAALGTDREEADRTYLEPLNAGVLEQIIIKEQPHAVVTTLGGQTALNLGYRLARDGVFQRYHVELLGPAPETVAHTEDPARLQATLPGLGLPVHRIHAAESIGAGIELGRSLGFPVVVKSRGALEGAGVFTAYNQEELEDFLARAFAMSPERRVSVEESLLGWVEIEAEVLRDRAGASLIVATLENIDPVGVHSGDSAVVLPARSLNPEQRDRFRECATGLVETLGLVGTVNLQFAFRPETGEFRLIEVNPRLTLSAVLAARFTGLPLAELEVRLRLGENLAALGLTGESREPDYTAVKMAAFDLEKFPDADPALNSAMKAVGSVLAFGSDFKEALQKAIRSLANGRYGLGADGSPQDQTQPERRLIREKIINAGPERLFYLRHALKNGYTPAELRKLTGLSGWFLDELVQLVAFEKELTTYALYNLPREVFFKAKRWGFSDRQLAFLLRSTEGEVRKTRKNLGVWPEYQRTGVARSGAPEERGWFSTYASLENGNSAAGEPRFLVVGPGPGRIGAGAERDYNAVKAAEAFAAYGESILVNCNPATAAGGAHPNLKLYWEPLTVEALLNVVERETPQAVVLQFGGGVALELAEPLAGFGVPLRGTAPETLALLRDRIRLQEALENLGVRQPEFRTVKDLQGALEGARAIGYPVRISPAGVPGGEIVYDPAALQRCAERILAGGGGAGIEKFFDNAVGVVLDGLTDGREALVGGIAEHIEEAGIHSGDSALSFPPYTLGNDAFNRLRELSVAVAGGMKLEGLFHLKFALQRETLYLLEIEPGAALTVPFLSKATGVPLVGAAVKILAGFGLVEQKMAAPEPQFTAVKEAVLPFERFPGVDPVLGPEMRSTGAVLGIASDFGLAYIKAQLAAGVTIPAAGTVFMSIREEDRRAFIPIARQLTELGFKILATEETALVLNRQNLPCRTVYRIGEGRPNILDELKNNAVQWIISIPSGPRSTAEESLIRSTAALRGTPIFTTVAGVMAAVAGLARYQEAGGRIKAVQDY
ncbi:carbamoyl-phosphate synthase large subunit [Hydrogenispora ethanolica]|uniref:Carbamoyl-phosphate synthase large subunit n=1 Tax=Hydrogenispora ethanolica TaxID=1082276 RepID=A0A4R1S7B6_HYDET|nr:carbamoyl-phosphate synthase large subunit [Hydrogenispora ethanolica]TCL75256.1 carbamoyl-phosphate synthase large subunit [Hydrogenispora ethanolica]